MSQSYSSAKPTTNKNDPSPNISLFCETYGFQFHTARNKRHFHILPGKEQWQVLFNLQRVSKFK